MASKGSYFYLFFYFPSRSYLRARSYRRARNPKRLQATLVRELARQRPVLFGEASGETAGTKRGRHLAICGAACAGLASKGGALYPPYPLAFHSVQIFPPYEVLEHNALAQAAAETVAAAAAETVAAAAETASLDPSFCL